MFYQFYRSDFYTPSTRIVVETNLQTSQIDASSKCSEVGICLTESKYIVAFI